MDSTKIENVVEKLYEWNLPRATLQAFKPYWNSVPDDQLFKNPRHKQLREVYSALVFATILSSSNPDLRVRAEQFENTDADFHIYSKGDEYHFQFTEVQKPERRRGDEYQLKKREGSILSPYRPAEGSESGPQWIFDSIQKKREKMYAEPLPHLLVYVNFQYNDLNSQKILDLCHGFLSVFPSIWLMNNWAFAQVNDPFKIHSARCLMLISKGTLLGVTPNLW